MKRALRLPAGLYGIGAGRLLGHRFLLLTHRGRRSGRQYRTMLEVVRWDSARCEATVMSGFGPSSNWRLNVLAGGAVEVQIAGLRFEPTVRSLEQEEAVHVMADYERRNRLAGPIVRTVLSRLAGFRYDGSNEARHRLVEALPLLGLGHRSGDASPDMHSGGNRELESPAEPVIEGSANRVKAPRTGWEDPPKGLATTRTTA